MQKIKPFLWFDTQAEEAANFYVGIFKNSKIISKSHYSDAAAQASGQPKGNVMTVAFILDGQEYVALNGGPIFKFTEAISLAVNCDSQDELDHFWDALSADGEQGQCGWLKDKYGLSWQIVPAKLGDIISNAPPEKSAKVMQALLQMSKLDIAALKQAAS